MSSREIKKTEEGLAYQIEVLSAEVKRLKTGIKKQIRLIEESGPNLSTRKVESELERLNKTFSELNSVCDRLRLLVSEEDAREIEREMFDIS